MRHAVPGDVYGVESAWQSNWKSSFSDSHLRGVTYAQVPGQQHFNGISDLCRCNLGFSFTSIRNIMSTMLEKLESLV